MHLTSPPLSIIHDIHGWLTDAEGELLARLAQACTGQGVIVEIGSWQGKSTVWLGYGSKQGNRVPIYAIDPHTGSPEQQQNGPVWTLEKFTKNIQNAGVADIVTPLVQTSQDAAKNFDKPVELIFIDGAHDYASVRSDFELWSDKVIANGIMAFHDTNKPGPQQVIWEKVCASRKFRRLRQVDSIVYVQKVGKNSWLDACANYIAAVRYLGIRKKKA